MKPRFALQLQAYRRLHGPPADLGVKPGNGILTGEK